MRKPFKAARLTLPLLSDALVRNLHAHNCRGIVGSWAAPGQRGTGHVNLRPREYVLQRFKELGYRPDEPLGRLCTSRR